MNLLKFLSILLVFTLSQVANGTAVRSIPQFGPGMNKGKGWMSFIVNPSTHAVKYISASPSNWMAIDTGKLTKDGGFNAFRIFQFGKDDWSKVQKTCFKPASICLDNNFSDKTNSERIQSSVTSDYSISNGITITGTVELDLEFIKMSTSISDTVTETWGKSIMFSQWVDCNVDPKDTVQTLAQVPYTLIEGYYVDAWCWNYNDRVGWYTCWTNLDGNDKAIMNFGNIKIPMKIPSMVKMGCFSRKVLRLLGYKLPCENGGRELCFSDAEMNLAFQKPAKLMELRVL